MSVKAFLGISRAPFLLLPIVLVAAGGAASAVDGGFSWLHAVVCLVGLVAAHAGVNAINEASDTQTGIDLHTERTPFSGGSGTLPSGQLTIRIAYTWGLGATALGLGCGLFLSARVGWHLLPVLLVGAFCVLAYTHLLARTGLGEVFAGLGLGALPVIGTSLAQDGTMGPATIAASIPAFLMTFNLLLLNEFPDEEADRAGGRRNLVLIFGRRAAARIYVAAALGVPVSLGVAAVLGALPIPALVAAAPTLAVVPAIRWALRRPHAPVPIPALGGNVIWNLVTNLVLAVTLVV
jgi:1,4-dihydroxy-2-naphthoate octaprenyltransferase